MPYVAPIAAPMTSVAMDPLIEAIRPVTRQRRGR
jgi:hypothetical protein